jgi:hypothetical protein
VLTFPDSLTTIGFQAFEYCEGITSINFGNSLTTIEDYAFQRTIGISGVLTLPPSLTTMGARAFQFSTADSIHLYPLFSSLTLFHVAFYSHGQPNLVVAQCAVNEISTAFISDSDSDPYVGIPSYRICVLDPTKGNYLRVTLWDSFGDGWGGVEWELTGPSGSITTATVYSSDEEKVFDVKPVNYPFPGFGSYNMSVTTVDSELPANWWEIYWKVEEFEYDGTPTGVYYEGAYGTTMSWEYAVVTNNTWTLVAAQDLPNFSCNGCSGQKCDTKGKPGPDNKKEKNGPIKGGKGKAKGKGNGRFLDGLSNSSESDGEIAYGDRNTDLTVKMFSEGGDKKKKGPNKSKKADCNGWEEVYLLSAHWYISDSAQTSLFDDGSLCEGCSGACDICLGDGSYVFRVTGPNFNGTDDQEDKTWQFCHARGNFNDQLNFHVKKGKCHPGDLRWASEISSDTEQESVVMVAGMIALVGIPGEILAAQARAIVIDTLAKTVEGWNIESMSVTTTSLDARSMAAGTRALRSYTHDIEFSVHFIAEDFSVDGASFAAVESLLADMAATLEASFSAGAFSEKLVEDAMTTGVDMLKGVTTVELLSLEVVSIEYAETHLVYYYGNDESVQSYNIDNSDRSVSTNAIIAFMSVAAVGFIAFVGVTRHGFNAYSKLRSATDSEVGHNMEMQMTVNSPFGATDQRFQPVNAGLKL